MTVPVDLPVLPRALPARPASWFEPTDVVVIGSGIAGLTAALHLREAGLHVTVVTKVNIDDGSTRWAQGGIAAVLDPLDTPAAHARDTLVAGVGLCDPAAVDVLVTEGPTRVRELIKMGAEFDRHPDGSLMLTREGGHHANRIVHAGGDATGAEVQRALHAAVRRDPWIRLVEHALVLDLLRDTRGRACGVTLHVLGEGTEDGVGAVLARAVVLATGGLGQIFAATTNPIVSTGDGVALALRAGADVTDLEFVQFHPTSLYLPNNRTAQQPLVSEALRGEGAYLVDGDGKRFMVGQHELAELAPRDVVAKGIHRQMLAAGTDHVYLDARHVPDLAHRFPTITAYCLAAGVDPTVDLIPVAPAAHYASGGVRTDLDGRTSIPGLYACGEVACTGVHGANRLASNSLLEGLVFARRIAADITRDLPPQADPVLDGPDRPDLPRSFPPDQPADPAAEGGAVGVSEQVGGPLAQSGDAASTAGTAAAGGLAWTPQGLVAAAEVPAVDLAARRRELQRAMTRGAGVLRSAQTLAETARVLREVGTPPLPGRTAGWEFANLLTVASALVASAALRAETRGCHWREDHAEADDGWRGHLFPGLAADGTTNSTWEAMA
ncbi:L-aspartate oxidase [Catellatospora sichuanensis]|uniref:L-aspartate oxidase n=1 Tax=Catellatospora sichuanensis TaxID=1969805 RepID=UPI001FE4B18D|nr:L-aspartate oxidase [Catellatospora sichuanensis]